MSIERPPRGGGRKEPVKLDAAAGHLLEECRMVLPGIQALFGFQLIAVFSERFGQQLSSLEQALHLAAITLVTISVALVMAPAAIHRQTQQREVSERFVWLSSRLMIAGMVPLAAALSLDVYLIGRVILGSPAASAGISAVVLAVLLALWFAVPRRERGLQTTVRPT